MCSQPGGAGTCIDSMHFWNAVNGWMKCFVEQGGAGMRWKRDHIAGDFLAVEISTAPCGVLMLLKVREGPEELRPFGDTGQ